MNVILFEISSNGTKFKVQLKNHRSICDQNTFEINSETKFTGGEIFSGAFDRIEN
jgi:hypothetical protein